jgi:phosphoribosyl-AMP cyclohydrolase / phosphoribosyl-ATP pyrophosphohydrolase
MGRSRPPPTHHHGSRIVTDRTLRTPRDLEGLAFDERGLVPVVAQDAGSGRVLMVAWANRRALEEAMGSGFMHYWSRSRNELWKKGATSGNLQRVRSLHADCDSDTVLARVEPAGPACHTGEATCFGAVASEPPAPSHVLEELRDVIRERARERPEGSYTTRLLEDENLRLKKLGEETVELVTALVRRETRASQEAADLLYHLLVALEGAGIPWEEVIGELERRRR